MSLRAGRPGAARVRAPAATSSTWRWPARSRPSRRSNRTTRARSSRRRRRRRPRPRPRPAAPAGAPVLLLAGGSGAGAMTGGQPGVAAAHRPRRRHRQHLPRRRRLRRRGGAPAGRPPGPARRDGASDFGIRGFDLAFSLVDGADLTILVDATARGGAPGTLYTIEPDCRRRTTRRARSRWRRTGWIRSRCCGWRRRWAARSGACSCVGCEPETFGPEHEGHMGLSAPVEAAVDEAVRIIEELVESTEVPWSARN